MNNIHSTLSLGTIISRLYGDLVRLPGDQKITAQVLRQFAGTIENAGNAVTRTSAQQKKKLSEAKLLLVITHHCHQIKRCCC